MEGDGERREQHEVASEQTKYTDSEQKAPSTSTTADGPENEPSRGSETDSNYSQLSYAMPEGRTEQEVPRLSDGSAETVWGEEEPGAPGFSFCSFSPPPKRKRPSHAVVLEAYRDPGLAENMNVGTNTTHLVLGIPYQADEKHAEGPCREVPLGRELPDQFPASSPRRPHRKYKLLHNAAMALTFVAIVSLWGIVDMGVELASGVDSGHQFQLYAVLLIIGVLAALALRKLKALSYRWTSYPTLLASLLTAAAAWGLVAVMPQIYKGLEVLLVTVPPSIFCSFSFFAICCTDVAIEAAAGEDKSLRLLYYFFGFLVAGFLVTMHVTLIDRSFRTVVEGFI